MTHVLVPSHLVLSHLVNTGVARLPQSGVGPPTSSLLSITLAIMWPKVAFAIFGWPPPSEEGDSGGHKVL